MAGSGLNGFSSGGRFAPKCYQYPLGYGWRWVWDDWDGVDRWVQRDGTIKYEPDPELRFGRTLRTEEDDES